MTLNLSEIRASIARSKKAIEKRSVDEFRETALRVDRAIVLATPVDTGRARANWLPSLNVPVTTVTNSTNWTQSLSDSINLTKKAVIGDVVYFSNNLPYIQKLNEGSSKQAPAAFVETAVAATGG